MHLRVVRSVVLPESLWGLPWSPILNVPYHWDFDSVLIEIIFFGEYIFLVL